MTRRGAAAEFKPRAHTIFRRTIRLIAKGLMWLLYRPKLIGGEKMPREGAYILIANHSSNLDPMAIQPLLKRWTFWVAKKELHEIPLLGRAFYWFGVIPLDREKADIAATKQILTVLRHGEPIGIFPQGTRVLPDQLDQVMPKPGTAAFAIRSGAPVVPVAVDAPYRLFRRLRIIVGEPFKLDLDPRVRYSHDQLMEITIDMMCRVYELLGIDYAKLWQRDSGV